MNDCSSTILLIPVPLQLGRHAKVNDRIPVYTESDVVIICFAIDNPQSFVNVKENVRFT